MARLSPSARVDSKNTVSPIAIAVTIESASSPRAPVDATANAPTPAVAVTQPSRSAPPTVARAALTTTEPSPGTSERTRRPFTAQVSAEPSAASAPRVDSAITPQIVRYPPALTPFARPCYSLATVRKEAHDGRPLGPLPSAAPPDDGRGRRRRGRRPRVVGGAAGAVPVQCPRAQAHGARRVARTAFQPGAEGLRGEGRVRAAGAGAAEARHVHRRQQPTRLLPGLGQLGRRVRGDGRRGGS